MINKCSLFLLLLFLAGGTYNLWALRPVKILYVYSDAGSTVSMVVDHLPWTDRDKISWYMARRDELKRKYPLYDEFWHTYNVLDIGDGFTNYDKSPDADLVCFPNLQVDDSCIVRTHLMIVNEYPEKKAQFYIVTDDDVYQLTPDNKIERVFQPEYLNQ